MTHTSTEQQIAAAWNAQADEFNQWDELDLCEKIEWAAHWGASQARVPLSDDVLRDAARYRWLRDDSRECMGNMGEIYVTQHALPNDEDSMDHDLFMDALDAAIDAALAAQAAKHGEPKT